MELPYYYYVIQRFTKSQYLYLDEKNQNVKDHFKNIFAYLTLINILECKFYLFVFFNNLSGLTDSIQLFIVIYTFFINIVSSLYSFEILKKINHTELTIGPYIKIANVYYLFLSIVWFLNTVLLSIFMPIYPVEMVNLFIYNMNVIIYNMFYINLSNIVPISNVLSLKLNNTMCKENTTCCICLDDIDVGNICHSLQCCNNKLHHSCYISYYFYNKELICPLCRYKNDGPVSI